MVKAQVLVDAVDEVVGSTEGIDEMQVAEFGAAIIVLSNVFGPS